MDNKYEQDIINDQKIEMRKEQEYRKRENRVTLLVAFFSIGAIKGLIIYAIYEIESAIYILPVCMFLLAVIISTIV